MLIFEKDIKISSVDLCNLISNFSNKINKYYIYNLLSKSDHNIILYSFDNSNVDINNCPCSLIYYEEYKDDEINIYIMFIATKYKFKKLGYASIFLKEFIDFIKNKFIKLKINIILDSLKEAASFYEHMKFKMIITDKYNKIFDINKIDNNEHFIMIYKFEK